MNQSSGNVVLNTTKLSAVFVAPAAVAVSTTFFLMQPFLYIKSSSLNRFIIDWDFLNIFCCPTIGAEQYSRLAVKWECRMDWEYWSRSSQISSLIFGGCSLSSISGLISVLKKVGLNRTSLWDEFMLLLQLLLADKDGVLEDDDVVDDDGVEVEDWSRLYNKLLSVYDCCCWHICYLILAEFRTNGT